MHGMFSHVTQIRSNIQDPISFRMMQYGKPVDTIALRMKDLRGEGMIKVNVHRLKESLRKVPGLEIHVSVNGELKLILPPECLVRCVRITFHYNGEDLTANGLKEQKDDIRWRIRALQCMSNKLYKQREADSQNVWFDIGKPEGEEMKERSENKGAQTVAIEANSRLEGNQMIELNEDDLGTLLPSPVSSGSDSSYDDGTQIRRQAGDHTASNLYYQGPSMVEGQADKVAKISKDDINGERERRFINTLIGYNGGESPEINCIEEMEEFRQSEIEVIRDGFIVFRFSNLEHQKEVLEKGQLFVNKRPLILKRWSPDDPVYERSLFLSALPIWVRFYNINFANWTEEYLREVSRDIGKFLYMDKSTAEHKRYDFARVCIEVDPSKELPDTVHVAVGDKTIPIKVGYEWKPSHDSISCKLAGEEVHLRIEEGSNVAGNEDGGELEQERLNKEDGLLWRIVMFFSQVLPSFRNTSPNERFVSHC